MTNTKSVAKNVDKKQGVYHVWKRQSGNETSDLFNFEVFESKYVRKQINKIYMKLHNKNDQKDTENSRQK